MCILVTGAGGFIGSHLCERLVSEGNTVRAFLRYNSVNSRGWLSSSSYQKDIEFFAGDIRDYDSVIKAMKGIQRVYHLAALISIPYSYQVQRAFIDVNVGGTLNILQAALDTSVERVVHTSTSEVYGTAQYVPMDEKHPINPQSPYAATKSGADFLAVSFFKTFHLPVVVIRPFNVFGPRQSARAIIPTIITQFLSDRKHISLGSLTPTRDFTFVKDTVSGFVCAGTSDSSEIMGKVFNIGSNIEMSVESLVNLISEITGIKKQVVTEDERIRPVLSEVERLNADNTQAKTVLGFTPHFSFREGLAETIEWFMGNMHLYHSELYNV